MELSFPCFKRYIPNLFYLHYIMGFCIARLWTKYKIIISLNDDTKKNLVDDLFTFAFNIKVLSYWQFCSSECLHLSGILTLVLDVNLECSQVVFTCLLVLDFNVDCPAELLTSHLGRVPSRVTSHEGRVRVESRVTEISARVESSHESQGSRVESSRVTQSCRVMPESDIIFNIH